MGRGNGISERGVVTLQRNEEKQKGRYYSVYTSDIMSQPNSRERGGAWDSKNPDPYYWKTIK